MPSVALRGLHACAPCTIQCWVAPSAMHHAPRNTCPACPYDCRLHLLPAPHPLLQYPSVLDSVRWSSGLPRMLLASKDRKHGLAAGAQLRLFRADVSGLKAALQAMPDEDWAGGQSRGCFGVCSVPIEASHCLAPGPPSCLAARPPARQAEPPPCLPLSLLLPPQRRGSAGATPGWLGAPRT